MPIWCYYLVSNNEPQHPALKDIVLPLHYAASLNTVLVLQWFSKELGLFYLAKDEHIFTELVGFTHLIVQGDILIVNSNFGNYLLKEWGSDLRKQKNYN